MKPLRPYVFSLLVLSSCTRPGGEVGSRVRIALPGQSTRIQSLPTDIPLCFLANVTGADLAPVTTPCAPSEGVSSGFADPGTTIELSVAKGKNRAVEIYAYIPATDQACAKVAALGKAQLNRLFLIGKKDGVDMMADVTTVDVTADLTDTTQHYGLQAGLAPACYANLPPVFTPVTAPKKIESGFHVASGSAIAHGAGGVTLIGRIGSKVPKLILTSPTGVQLRVK